MHHIDGIDRDQITMFPEALDDYISEDNPVRIVDAFVGSLDLSSCSKRTKGFGKA
jgi:transposase